MSIPNSFSLLSFFQLPNDTISRRCESYRLWKIGQLLSKIRLMKKVLFVVKLRLESSLETLYAGTEVSVPEFDLGKSIGYTTFR